MDNTGLLSHIFSRICVPGKAGSFVSSSYCMLCQQKPSNYYMPLKLSFCLKNNWKAKKIFTDSWGSNILPHSKYNSLKSTRMQKTYNYMIKNNIFNICPLINAFMPCLHNDSSRIEFSPLLPGMFSHPILSFPPTLNP